MKVNSVYPNLLQFDILAGFRSLINFTTTITGGVSEGNYTSFNLGLHSGDDCTHVLENRRRLATFVNVKSTCLYFPHQVHGTEIRIIDKDFLSKPENEKAELLNGIDAVITDRKNICIGVSTADCVPILIYDPQKHILAAIHAGWRGTQAQIAAKTIRRMGEEFGCQPSDLRVGIGPAISAAHFEVGDEVVEAFADAGYKIGDIGYVNSETQKTHIDLWRANEIQLSEAGVLPQNIEVARKFCTFSCPDMFFSARRQTINSGRMITGGVLL
ncbi:YfiH family protein [Dysgonomonas sp. PH5-45]|uniref:peptidoglycan editing factor PgeF n=1 Tax=unclassified Dysgonomonas TaxID=2630389 RepID=UPI0024732BC8|nr:MULTISPECIES: peptidoglycan editing factor PgeF [unclassified Dysgonomonas]MDH6355799.1 YfiH family protein [Dysgonomonas sp. PH5-45]MDH6388696.1 YfiH family protein [Dysgonomonas sp. PH5-37]